MKFFVFILAISLSGGVLGASTGSEEFFWFERDDGHVVPAFTKGDGGKRLTKNEITDVKFYLYTLDNPDVAQELIPGNDEFLDASNFRANTETKILAHGFTGSGLSGWPQDLKNKYMQQGRDVNVIVVHWEMFAEAPWYDTAAANTQPVGQWSGSLIDHLVRAREVIQTSHVHFIGHSLGAHVGGFCGAWIAPRLSPIARITGMDPAQPLFFYETENGRLDPSDAAFVDILHTAAGPILANPPGLGFEAPIGHIDFYPNSGKPIQPGCGLDIAGTCSHSRAHQFFMESVTSPSSFQACKCNSWDDFNNGICGCPSPEKMGEWTKTDHSSTGVYYLRTNGETPFSMS
jgi:hypothetical protein